MKKSILILATLSLAFAACNKEMENPVKEGSRLTKITASREAPVSGDKTKSTISDEGVFAWSGSDKIKLYTTQSSFYELTLNTGADTPNASFSGVTNGQASTVAVFPANTNPSLSGNTLTLNLPGSMAWESGEADNIMVAKGFAEGASDISFKNVGGIIKVSLKGIPATADKVVFTTGKKISGSFTCDISAGEPMIAAGDASDLEADGVTFTFEELTSATDRVFYIPVPTGDYSKIGFKVKAGDTVLAEFQGSSANTIGRGTLLKMPELTITTIGGSGEGALLSVEVPANYNGDFVLPKTKDNVSVKLNATTNSVSLKYASGASDEEKPKNVYINVASGATIGTLGIVLPSSHVELNGNGTTDMAISNVTSSTNTATLVLKTVKVDKLTINKGSLKVQDGSQIATSLTVAEDAATSDEEANKVSIDIAEGTSVAAITVSETNCNFTIAGTVTGAVETKAASTTVSAGASISNTITVSAGSAVIESGAKVDGINASENADVEVAADVTKTNGTDAPETTGTITTNKVKMVEGEETSYYETINAAIEAASDGAQVIILKAGEYTITNITITKSLTIEGGVEGVQVNHTSNSNIATLSSGITATFKNITFNLGETQMATAHGFGTGNAQNGKLVMDQCNINGALNLFGESEFTNCTFTASNNTYNIWAVYNNASFTDCVFNNVNRAINVYDPNFGSVVKNVNFTSCVFKGATQKKKAAVNIHHNPDPVRDHGARYHVSITDCTTEGTWASSVEDTGEPEVKTVCRSALWMISDIENWNNGDITVTVDDKAQDIDVPVAVAQVGDNTYTSLVHAIEEASAEATITLLTDTAGDFVIPSGKSITLNLGGHKVTNSTGDTFTIELGGTFTIDGDGTVDNVTHQKADIYNNGTVFLKGGHYTRSAEAGSDKNNSGGNSFYNILNHGTMSIDAGVEVTSNGHFSSLIDNGYYSYSSGNARTGHVSGTNAEAPSLTINGGTFSGGLITIKNDDNASLNISGGTFNNVTQAVVQNNHTATISSGIFDAGNYAAVQSMYYAGGRNSGATTITGGEFKGSLYKNANDASFSISGGQFNDPSALNYVTESASGVTVRLTSNCSVSKGITVRGNATLNLNSHTLTSTSDAVISAEGNGKTLTITGDGTIDASGYNGTYAYGNVSYSDGIVLWAKGGNIVVENGTFISKGQAEATVYVSGANSTITINGGTFKNVADGAYPFKTSWKPMVLNVKNECSVQSIVVNGGSFYNQNPAQGDDHLGGTFVTSGKTVTETIDGDYKVYTVQ